jgi:hypothetical protein
MTPEGLYAGSPIHDIPCLSGNSGYTWNSYNGFQWMMGGAPLLPIGADKLNGGSLLQSGPNQTEADSVLTGTSAIASDTMAQVQLS